MKQTKGTLRKDDNKKEAKLHLPFGLSICTESHKMEIVYAATLNQAAYGKQNQAIYSHGIQEHPIPQQEAYPAHMI